MVAECCNAMVPSKLLDLPYDELVPYFTCELAGTAVVHVITALVSSALAFTLLIKVCPHMVVGSASSVKRRALRRKMSATLWIGVYMAFSLSLSLFLSAKGTSARGELERSPRKAAKSTGREVKNGTGCLTCPNSLDCDSCVTENDFAELERTPGRGPLWLIGLLRE